MMMNDDKNQDDDFIDDLDFDDLDDDDFDVETADSSIDEPSDIEDDMDDDWGDSDFEEDDDSADEEPKRKKSGSKMLLPLFLVIAGLGGGGYYYYNQFLANPSSTTLVAANVNTDNGNIDIADSAPSPTSIDIANDSLPMPSPISTEEMSIDTEDSVSIESDFPGLELSIDAPETLNDNNSVLTPMPNLASSNAAIDAPEPSVSQAIIDPSQIEAIDTAPAIALEEPKMDIDLPDPAAAGEEMIDFVPEQNTEETEPLSAKITQIRSEMDAAKSEMQTQINNLNSLVAEKDETIRSLNNQIETIQMKLNKKEIEKNTITKKAVISKKAAIKEKTTPLVAELKNTAIPKVIWNLRSAQPGKAFISQKGSNDVQVVETGDTVKGIGTIKSISIQNGLWVVEGTKIKITQ